MKVKTGWDGRYFEDFQAGDIYPHPLGRTVTQTDNIWFTLLTQNTNPVHFDEVYAIRAAFGGLHVYFGACYRTVDDRSLEACNG
ncbi:MAG TPA: hypothetical protein VFK27_01545 [Bacillales bacterium]|nr:hypothetical protein [Bacillales bacterium]